MKKLWHKVATAPNPGENSCFLPFSTEASLLLVSVEPPSFAFAAIRGGFSSLLLKRSLREASLRLALQQQASCLLLPGRLRSLPPPSMAAFLRYRSALSSGGESTTRPSSSKPPACFFRAAFVRFRRPPWRLFFAIAQRSLREASLRLALQQQASCLLLPGRLRSLPPPSMAAFLRYRSALSSGGESTTRPPAASLLLASSGPPSFASAALHGGFSSLSLSALFGRRVYDSPSSSKPPACFFRAAFVRFRRPPWRLFFAIAQRSLREASLRLASPPYRVAKILT